MTAISLLVFGWIIHSVGWSRLVRTNWGMGDLGLLNDVVVFLPFLLIQLLVWWGQFLADRALAAPRRDRDAGATGDVTCSCGRGNRSG